MKPGNVVNMKGAYIWRANIGEEFLYHLMQHAL